jgi:phosphatidate cytidylyltransferase
LAALLALWVGYPFAILHAVWALMGHTAFVLLLVLSKIGDIAGYYVGNAIGKTHPFQGISPGKTTAGCVGSLVVAVVASVLAAQLGWLGAERWAWASGVAFGLAINLAAQAGDLFESVVKRKSVVKDSGTWFGPSGGVLDLVDSLLFTVPVALLTWPLFFAAPTP